MKQTPGFTLIELMIVVAIIGILSSFAIPTYQSYTKRAHASEILSTMSALKVAVGICISTTGSSIHCTSGQNGVPAKQDFNSYSIESLSTDEENIIKAVTISSKGSLPSDSVISLTSQISTTGLTWKVNCTGIDNQSWCPRHAK
ncbi:pilin [Vibrio pectenicida]|uniref:Prepilin-type N-terminal cleavage/methylation domain-containing protein n=1 Tax=Vibrio pectenicida TaxID=62763 RepID=A0A3R9G5K9_9VIBR|nr:prepilin-type N-terminal cleavage/methylation domain-containing protein [Vibrio pectenicida]RSD32613.1 prepilin-type N-terminal cleavage/methylation domain-containing protein [Vibrio pectenicida]